jgi:imidazole glycerol-phosphate synthase subunit HisF
MITKRLIPCLDVDKGKVVKGKKFVEICEAGDPLLLAKEYARQGADELVLLDITASHEGRNIFLDVVNTVAKQVFIPFTVGGGITSLTQMRQLLLAGADKVSINTAALQDPRLIKAAASMFGSQCVVVAIDVIKNEDSWSVYSHGGRKPTGRDAIAWAKEAEAHGAGELLVTSMDCDGTKQGYDLVLLKTLAQTVNIPIIASGGVGSWKHIRDAFLVGNADAALMASILHFKETTIPEIKTQLKQTGILVR